MRGGHLQRIEAVRVGIADADGNRPVAQPQLRLYVPEPGIRKLLRDLGYRESEASDGDRTFVGQLATDPGSAAIVRATIELGGSLGLDVVAEGVEDAATWQMLNRLGCSTAQGYFLSRPMPAAEVAAWMRHWPERQRALQDTELAA